MVIETLSLSDTAEVSLCPQRGGIITSVKLHDTEVLYLDRDTFENPSTSVRGGIPILFPNAGAFSAPEFPKLTQHGFARESSGWVYRKTSSGFIETLVSDENSLSVYPYEFKLSIEGRFEGDHSFTIFQIVENTGDKTLPVAMGLHPYFKVPDARKAEILFNFEGGKYIEEKIGQWSQGTFISIDNPKIKDPKANMEVIIPELGTLLIDASVEYKKIWIWSQPGKDFICIEPVMRDPNGLVDDPQEIAPGKIFSGHVTITLQKQQ